MDRSVILEIDGQEVKAYEGQKLVDVARENNHYIPTLCHFPDINPPAATCRVCMVKINGKYETGCTSTVHNGMKVETNTPEILDDRKANIELLFAEGNHFCPACSKSGNCELQRKSYENNIAVSRFPHLFEQRPLDFKSSRIVLEHSRCIHCRRCVDLVKTDDGEKVFSFHDRGHSTHIGIDYKNEKKLSKEQAIAAMNLCPVGAILVKGESGAKPFGLRKYDDDRNIKYHWKKHEELEPLKDGEKRVIATTSLAGCFGCHMSMLDIDLDIVDLFQIVEFNKSPLTDIKKFSKQCDIGIIEGGVANSENYEILKEFRKKCKVLISMGECAIWGGIPGMRNVLPLEDCLKEAYLNTPTSEPNANVIPHDKDIPKILDKVYSCSDIVKIDYVIPGCPPNPEHIWKVVKNILLGTDSDIDYKEFKYD